MPTSAADCLYFTRLELENVKSFGDPQEVDFTCDGERPARWTLILADNNVGKTTLLQCLARMRPDVANRMEGDLTGSMGFLPELAAEEDNGFLESLVRHGRDVEARIQVAMVAGYMLDGKGTKPNPISCSAVIERRKDRFHDARWDGTRKRLFRQPVVFAYGAGRHVRSSNSDEDMPDGVASLWDASIELVDAEKILQRLDYHVAKFPDRGPRMRLKALTEMLAEILPDVSSASDVIINPPATAGLGSANYGVRVVTSTGEVPLSQLSLGYQTIAAWTIDIAWRLINEYPDSPRPMKEPAVVIVDEIDLHLHPRWQRELRSKLTTHFPNVQFIATAHSPLMAQDYLDQNLVLLQLVDGMVEVVNDPIVVRDWSIDQLLTSELFGLPSARSRETSDAVARRLELLGKPTLDEVDETELTELETRVSALGPKWNEDDEVARRVIQLATRIAKASHQG